MPDTDRHTPYTAIILAGERGPGDPLVEHTSACCKAMVEIDGTPMILRVLAALDSAALIDHCLLSGPGHGQNGGRIPRHPADRDGQRRLV